MESVWDYPRPPRLERVDTRVTVEFGGLVIADTTRGLRMLETSHPPSWYLPPDDVLDDVLERAGQGSICEWKGAAHSWSVRVGDRVAEGAAWSYPKPAAPYAELKDHLAFYCGPMDRCTVGGVVATPQPGGFYGGWVTPDLKGPFKGGPGTLGW